MATGTDPAATDRATSYRVKPYRLTARQCQAMARAGIFNDDKHIELLGGILVRKMTTNPPHNFVVGELVERFAALVPPRWIVRDEKSIELALRWQPEPDVAVVLGPRRRYEAAHVTAADVALLVEVADSNYAQDRGIKWRKYAAAGIPVYWIVNLARRQVEVYRRPMGAGLDAAYQLAENYGDSAAVPVVVDGQEVGQINVTDFLPSAPRAEG